MSEFLEAMQEAADILTGKRQPARLHTPIDVRAIRRRRKLTQQAFAERFGFTVGAVRDWEQGRFQPEQAARAYLLVIDREPDAVERALSM